MNSLSSRVWPVSSDHAPIESHGQFSAELLCTHESNSLPTDDGRRASPRAADGRYGPATFGLTSCRAGCSTAPGGYPSGFFAAPLDGGRTWCKYDTMPARRSSFLFHWTGKDISTKPNELSEEDRIRYVERLRSLLMGLWLSFCIEVVKGAGAWGPRTVCFTETRLSVTGEHARRYGLLGLGFSREFVLRYHGAPVHYVRGRPPESLMGDLHSLMSWLSNLQVRFAEDSEIHREARENFLRAYHLLAFMKPMTAARNSVEDFELLHEHEWRIVHTRSLEGRLRLVREKTETEAPLWAVPIEPNDVRFVIVPDDATRTLISHDKEIQGFLSRAAILTLEEASEL